MKAMAWRVLCLLLFHSLAVVSVDLDRPDRIPVLIPDYEDTLPDRESACWTSIKMLAQDDSSSKRGEKKTQNPEHSGLSDKNMLETLARKAGIQAFNQINCYAAPDERKEVNKCHEMASRACSSKDYKSVTLIYQIQQQQKNKLKGSLLQLSKKTKDGKQLIIVLFIDCQNPTDMDMDDNPTRCEGGIRLDFDPTFSKHFPRAQIEIRSDGNPSDTEIYPGGLLAREKVKGSFLMKLEDGISSDCRPKKKKKKSVRGIKATNEGGVRAIKATNEGVELLDSNGIGLGKMTGECVFKNELPNRGAHRSLLIYRKNKDQLETVVEQKLQPQESVRVNPLSHIEIYPFFSVPESLVEKSAEAKENSEKFLFAFHLELMNKKPKEGEKDIVIKTEQLKHKNWFLCTFTCWDVASHSALQNCLERLNTVPWTSGARRIFVSSGDRTILTVAIDMVFKPCTSKHDWKPCFERRQAKYKFIKVGEWSAISEIPDPILFPRRDLSVKERKWRRDSYDELDEWLLSKLGDQDKELVLSKRNEKGDSNENGDGEIQVQPPPVVMKGDLHLDVALFHGYHPLQASFVAIKPYGSSGQIACLNHWTTLRFNGAEYTLVIWRLIWKDQSLLVRKVEKELPNEAVTIRFHLKEKILSYFDKGKNHTEELLDISRLTLKSTKEKSRVYLQRSPPGSKNPKPGFGDMYISYNIDITFLELDLRSTAIFS